MRVSVWGAAPALRAAGGPPSGTRRRLAAQVVFARRAASSPRCSAASPRPANEVAGPALWALPQATLLIPPGWAGEVDAHGTDRA